MTPAEKSDAVATPSMPHRPIVLAGEIASGVGMIASSAPRGATTGENGTALSGYKGCSYRFATK